MDMRATVDEANQRVDRVFRDARKFADDFASVDRPDLILTEQGYIMLNRFRAGRNRINRLVNQTYSTFDSRSSAARRNAG